MKIKLSDHRLNLFNNEERYLKDKDRAVKNLSNHIWSWAKEENPFSKKKDKIAYAIALANIIFDSQGQTPLFEFGDKILAWNNPKDWEHDYIRYEVGHMNPRNNGGKSNPENLCFMSARCNQHIQSSLPLEEVIEHYFNNNNEVIKRIQNLKESHESDEWRDLIESLIS